MEAKILLRLSQVYIILKIYTGKIIYFLLKHLYKKKMWLIIERGSDARDNGFEFFKYSISKDTNIDIRYIIDKCSKDFNKVKNHGNYINYGSLKHLILLNHASVIISTHDLTYIPKYYLVKKFIDKKIIKYNAKKVFLQHGIIKDYLPQLCYPNTDFDIFICGAQPEYEYVLENFNYNEKVIKYTGLARFDKLHDFTLKRQILLMPTWRIYLNNLNDIEFCESNYYKIYNNLINNKKLTTLLDKCKYELIFYPHYEVQKFLHLFNTKSNRIKIASFNKYDVQELLKESEILITDYSSVYFDFAYMQKPLVYYQFDKLEFTSSHYPSGYFNYETMGFGPVVDNEKQLIDIIEKYILNEFYLEEVYKKRCKSFFKIQDNKNCERIYDIVHNL